MESSKEYIDLTHQLEFLERTYAETTGKKRKQLRRDMEKVRMKLLKMRQEGRK